MKKLFKKVLASLMTVAFLSLCAVSSIASASEDTFDPESNISEESTRYTTNFTLTDNIFYPLSSITGYASVSVYAHPYGGSVSILVYEGTSYIQSFFFDASGYAPVQTLTVPDGKRYTLYLYSSSASQSNPITGYASIT